MGWDLFQPGGVGLPWLLQKRWERLRAIGLVSTTNLDRLAQLSLSGG